MKNETIGFGGLAICIDFYIIVTIAKYMMFLVKTFFLCSELDCEFC